MPRLLKMKVTSRTLGQSLDRVQLARKPKPTEKCLMTPANLLLPRVPAPDKEPCQCLDVREEGRSGARSHRMGVVYFPGLPQPARLLLHSVAHERVLTSWAGREWVCLLPRRLPLWLSEKECVCLSKQNFPVDLEEWACLPARKERVSVWIKREKNSTVQAHQPWLGAAFLPHKDSQLPQQLPTNSVCLGLEAGGGADEAMRGCCYPPDSGKTDT
ncbi:uncharacterized protein LOC116657051 [Camelus ferus]|uniref:Uncharacterized protein LOC116657051 n=1 Tax=Camelus ferus TaxID=419612 RepID=A0A8B8R7E2_CAMFR|nr:uncharacterized protein LOC116657051 [Camelus ferus]